VQCSLWPCSLWCSPYSPSRDLLSTWAVRQTLTLHALPFSFQDTHSANDSLFSEGNKAGFPIHLNDATELDYRNIFVRTPF
jgi:hypothetical protein